jgi:hypothetical protein
VGATFQIRIEPFDANPQLASFYLSDTLAEDLDAQLYYAVSIPH